MRFFDYFRVALKNLWRQKARTMLTILAVVIGAVSVLVMLSLVVGARDTLTSQVEKIGGLTLITVSASADSSGDSNLFSSNGGPGDGKKLDDAAVATLVKIPHVSDGSPIAQMNARSMHLEGQQKQTYPQVIAYDPSTNVFQVDLLAGRTLHPGDMDKIVMSISTLRQLGFTGSPEEAVGKRMVFVTQGGMTNDWLPDPPKPPENADDSWRQAQQAVKLEYTADIVGVASSGIVGEQNLITLDWARKLMTQKMWQDDQAAEKLQKDACQQAQQAQQKIQQQGFGRPGIPGSQLAACQFQRVQVIVKEDMLAKQGYVSVMLKSDSTSNVEDIAAQVRKDGYGATTAKDILDQITKIMTAVGAVLGAIGGISLFVAAIGIINTMIMAIYERTREIGVLRACGATRATIRRLFTFEAALLGFWGGVIGFLAAYGISQLANVAVEKYAVNLNIPIQGIMTFPLWLVGGVITFTTVIGLLAGWYPSVRAARLDPVEALRYE